MIKASQEKQVFVCTSTKKISIAITKVHSEREKKKLISGKSCPRLAPNLWSTDKTKTKPKPKKSPNKKALPVFLFYLETFAFYKVIT